IIYDKSRARMTASVNAEAIENGEYTQEQAFRLQEIRKEHADRMSPFSNGDFREGLALSPEGKVIKTVEILKGESLLAYELNILQERRIADMKQKQGEQGVPQKFIDKMLSKPAEEQLDF